MTQKKTSTDKKRKAPKKTDQQKLTRLIEDIIDKGATTAEDINRAVLDLPVAVLVSLGLEETAGEVKKIQDISIGTIYQLIRDINHQVADTAADLLDQRAKKRK